MQLTGKAFLRLLEIIIMDPQKTTIVHLETVEDRVASENAPPERQKTTPFMIIFSLYIALAGWIYNFDLGQIYPHLN